MELKNCSEMLLVSLFQVKSKKNSLHRYVFLEPTITTLLIAIPIKKANMSNDFTIKYSHPHEGFWLETIFVSPVHRVNIDKIHVNLCTTWLDIVFASPDRSRRSDGPYDPPGPFGEHLEVWFWRPIHLKRSQKIIIHYIVTLDVLGTRFNDIFYTLMKNTVC